MNCFLGTEKSVSVAEKQQEKNYLGRKFKWKIKNFSSLGESTLYSDTFAVNENRWRLVLYPKGYIFGHLAVFLSIADPASLPDGWSRSVKFSIAVVDQMKRSRTFILETETQFTAEASSWGSNILLPLGILRSRNWGYLLNDTCLIEAQVFDDSMESVNIKAVSFLRSIPKQLSSPVSDAKTIDTLVPMNLQDLGELVKVEVSKQHLRSTFEKTSNLLEDLVKRNEEMKMQLVELVEREKEVWTQLKVLKSKYRQLREERGKVLKQTKQVHAVAEEQFCKIEGKEPEVDPANNKLKKKSFRASVKALFA